MSLSFPIPRSPRATPVLASGGQTVFGPFDWPLYDVPDLDVSVLLPDAETYEAVPQDAYTVVPVSTLPGLITVVLDAGAVAGAWYEFAARRTQERTLDVTQGGVVRSAELERELDKQSTVLQELRRDVDHAIRVPVTEEGVFVLPPAERRKGKILYFDEYTGRPKALTPARGALLASIPQHLQADPSADLAATPAGVKAKVDSVAEALDLAKQSRDEKGEANGYAGLDATGKVPTEQLPMASIPQHLQADPSADLAATPAGVKAKVDSVAEALDLAKQSRDEKGAANGYAGLDATGKVPTEQLPMASIPQHLQADPSADLAATPAGVKAKVDSVAEALDLAKQSRDEKGAANGYAGLDATGKVPLTQLPALSSSTFSYNLSDFLPSDFESGDDATEALDDALAALNATGGTLFIPRGQYGYSGDGYLVLRKGRIVGEGPQSIIFREDGDNRFVQIGDPDMAQFACINLELHDLHFENRNPGAFATPNDTRHALSLQNAFRVRVINCNWINVNRWLNVGQQALCATMVFRGCLIAQHASNLTSISLYHLGHLEFDELHMYVHGGGEWLGTLPSGITGAMRGVEMIPGTDQSIDAVIFRGGSIMFYPTGCFIRPSGASNCHVVNLWFDNIWDSCQAAGFQIVDNAFVVATVHHGANFWLSTYKGYAYAANLTGNLSRDFMFTGSHIFGAGAYGVAFSSTGTYQAVNRAIHWTGGGVDKIGDGEAGIGAFSIGCNGVYLANMKIGGSAAGFLDKTALYGVIIQDHPTEYSILGCEIHGTSSALYINSGRGHTAGSAQRFIRNCSGIQGNLGSFTPAISSGVPFVNTSPFDMHIVLKAGTISSATLTPGSGSPVSLGTANGAFSPVVLKPGWTLTLTGTSMTFAAFYAQ